MQDRKRLLSLPMCPEPPHSNNLPQLPPNPPSGGASIVISNSTVNSSANGASCSGSLKVKMVKVTFWFHITYVAYSEYENTVLVIRGNETS